MSSSIFRQLGGVPFNNLQKQLQSFISSMQGKNPQEEINKLLQSGRISQQQLNQAQQMAQQMRGILGGK